MVGKVQEMSMGGLELFTSESACSHDPDEQHGLNSCALCLYLELFSCPYTLHSTLTRAMSAFHNAHHFRIDHLEVLNSSDTHLHYHGSGSPGGPLQS